MGPRRHLRTLVLRIFIVAMTLSISTVPPPVPGRWKRALLKSVLVAAIGVLLVWSWFGTEMDLRNLAHSAPRIAEFVDRMLPPPLADAPALTMERELVKIASHFDRPTADIVALVMEYPWTVKGEPVTR